MSQFVVQSNFEQKDKNSFEIIKSVLVWVGTKKAISINVSDIFSAI
jgi:hypothetical protein